MRFRLVPRDEGFYPLSNEAARNLATSAGLLCELLDDVVDDIHGAADLLMLHHVDAALPEMHELADILRSAAAVNERLIAKPPRLRGLEPGLEEIDRLESLADAVYRRSVARFSGEYKAFAVLEWKDVVEALEHSVNAIEDIADIVESIVSKNA